MKNNDMMNNNNMITTFYGILIAVITGIAYLVGTDTIPAESGPLAAFIVLALAGIILLDSHMNIRARLAV